MAGLPEAFGIGSALTWGTADFAGGLATKRSRVHGVLFASQGVGLVLLPLVALALGEALPETRGWLLGSAAGLAGALGIGCLYAALATGRMGIAAPITALLAAAIPVLYGSLREGPPGALTLIGFGLALIGVTLLTRPDPEHGAVNRRSLTLALLSGLGFGALLILLGEAGRHGTYWPLAAARVSSISAVILAALLMRSPVLPARGVVGIALLAGLTDVSGNVFFILASQLGRLDVAAVLSSLYPAATVLLARFVLHERLGATQWLGVAFALAAIPLIVM